MVGLCCRTPRDRIWSIHQVVRGSRCVRKLVGSPLRLGWREPRGEASGRVGTGSSPLWMSPALEGERDILRKLQSAMLPFQIAALRSHVVGNTKRKT